MSPVFTEKSRIVRHLWLDLEDTTISSVVDNAWGDCELINVELIKEIVADWNPDFINIFSFAIWDKHDLAEFDKHIRQKLEDSIGRKLSFVWTMDDDIVPMSCAEKGLYITYPATIRDDVRRFFGKQDSFKLCVKHMFQASSADGDGIELMFVDDDVFDEIFVWPRHNIRGSIFNVESFERVSK